MAPRGLQDAFWSPNSGPERLPGAPKKPPRLPQDAPRRPQEPPRGPQEASQTPQKAPKRLQSRICCGKNARNTTTPETIVKDIVLDTFWVNKNAPRHTQTLPRRTRNSPKAFLERRNRPLALRKPLQVASQTPHVVHKRRLSSHWRDCRGQKVNTPKTIVKHMVFDASGARKSRPTSFQAAPRAPPRCVQDAFHAAQNRPTRPTTLATRKKTCQMNAFPGSRFAIFGSRPKRVTPH